MQNDQLKNNIAPWQSKGRWYNFTLENYGAGSNRGYKITNDQAERLPFSVNRSSTNGVTIGYTGHDLIFVEGKTIPQTLFDTTGLVGLFNVGSLTRTHNITISGLPSPAGLPGTCKVEVYAYVIPMENIPLE